MKAPLTKLRFALYTHTSHRKRPPRNLTWRQLRKIPGLFARAEESGSEACYVEIAKWNRHSRTYHRFAFIKLFGGELWQDLSDTETCVRLAAMINVATKTDIPLNHHPRKKRTFKYQGGSYQASSPQSIVSSYQHEYASIIHSMPTWHPTAKAA